jgi:hypothetical protein
VGGKERNALYLEEAAARLGRIEHARQVARAARMISLADRSSPTWAEEAEVRKEVDAAHLQDRATSEFGEDVDTILIEFIEDLSYGIGDPDYDDGSLYSEWELAFEILGYVATAKAVDFLERTGGYAFKAGADPESDFLFSARYAISAMARVGGDRAQEVLMAWFDAVSEGWELDENALWALLPEVAPFLDERHVPKVLWLTSLSWQDVQKALGNLLFARRELFKPAVIDGLGQRDPMVAAALHPLFGQSRNAEETRLLEAVRDDPAADLKLRSAVEAVLVATLPPNATLLQVPAEQISKWRSLATEAGWS